MKILHINWSGDIGGAENFAFQLARTQKADGHDVAICYMTNRSIIGQQVIELGIKIFECEMRNAIDFFNFYKCLKLIQSEKYDIIHNHNGSPFLNIAKFFSPCSILINHCHGTRFGNEKWESNSILFWNRLSSCLVDHYFANSGHTKKIIIDKYGLPDHRTSVLYNGIDLGSFQPTKKRITIRREFGLKNPEKVIGTVARLTPQKGIDKFIEVAKRVTRDVKNVKFLIVGDGELRSALEEQVVKLNLQDKVIFTGARTDVANLLSIFDIFLLTSNWEPFGITLLEAMAMGVPIIAFSVDAVPEVVNETCAVLVNPGDIKTMSQEVVNLLGNRLKQEKLIQSGFKRVKEFNIKRISKKSIDVYKRLLNKSKSAN